MIAEFRARHKSVIGFESVDFPDFTILTGRNGSGKTHLLQAIDQGYVVIQGILSDDIRYFSYHSFVVSTADEDEKYRQWNKEEWLSLQEALRDGLETKEKIKNKYPSLYNNSP